LAETERVLVCGIVMPISTIDGCAEPHWSDVREILTEAIEDAGFEANLVSNADDVGIIQKRIIQNLYENPVVVCDVSGKNPNVMFELGLRLAFDKPTIIVKDDKTSYSFDTSPIEHLEYPRDLRFSRIVEFKEKLADKIRATYERSASDSSYTTFLKHFGEFTVVKLDKKEVPTQEFILEELAAIRLAMNRLDKQPNIRSTLTTKNTRLDVCLRGMPESELIEAAEMVRQLERVKAVELRELAQAHSHIVIDLEPESDEVKAEIRSMLLTKARQHRVRGRPIKKEQSKLE
jgi:hypothetical protein